MEDFKDINGFIIDAWDDIKSPTTSEFISKLPQIKTMVYNYEQQVVDMDRSGVTKLRKSIKAMVNSGNVHIENEKIFAESLEKLGNYALQLEQDQPEIAEAFIKFAIVAKDVSALMKNLMSNLRNTVMCPLEAYTKNDSSETHAEFRKAFDKAMKDLDAKFHKVEKERLRLAESAGLHRKGVSGQEIAEDTDKERKALQLQTCEYLLRVNEAKSKKGVDLLNHLVEYYQTQTNFFKDGMQTVNHFNNYVTSLVPKLKDLKSRQETEKKELQALKESLKNSLASYKELSLESQVKSSPPHSFAGSKDVGSEFAGYLLKKSEGKIKKVWQKRRCTISDGVMYISHSDENKPPVRLNLLTCQAKIVPDDPGKKCFDLLSSSNNRTYHFQAEDEQEMVKWISVLNNAKEEQLLLAFSEDRKGTGGNENIRELRKQLIADIRKLPGNRFCCDCGMKDPEWLSVNFGVLICLECCGVHREMGVHISRTQSLIIDELGTSQLLIARVMTNQGFNDIMEAALTPDSKEKLIQPDSKREQRNAFIRAKYELSRYAIRTCADQEELKQELLQAIKHHDIYALLQVHAEGLDLMTPLPAEISMISNKNNRRAAVYDIGETALHKAISQESGTSLYIIDFLVQNSNSKKLEYKDSFGNTALHAAAHCNQGEAMKLILRANQHLASIKNEQDQTPLDVAKANKFTLCIELLQHALDGKTSLFENVNIDWLLIQDDYIDFSDDELESQTPEITRSRPNSIISDVPNDCRFSKDKHNAPSNHTAVPRSERRRTGDCLLEDKAKEHKAVTVDRLRRKTADNISAVYLQPSAIPMLTHKGSIKSREVSSPHPSGHQRAGSDQTGSHQSEGSMIDSSNKSPHSSILSLSSESEKGSSISSISSVIAKGKPPPLPEKKTKLQGSTASFQPVTSASPMCKSAVLESPLFVADAHSTPAPQTKNGTVTQPEALLSKPSHDLIVKDTANIPSSGPKPQPRPKPKLAPHGSLPIRKRCRALYDCVADNTDELSFAKDEVIVIIKSPADSHWWEGEIDGNPKRKGLFPTTHVAVINDL